MTEFSNTKAINARFTKGELDNISMSIGNYTSSITFQANSDTVNIQFANKNDLMHAAEMLITAIHKMEWHKDYDSTYVRSEDETLITTGHLKVWEMSHAEHEANAAAYARRNGEVGDANE